MYKLHEIREFIFKGMHLEACCISAVYSHSLVFQASSVEQFLFIEMLLSYTPDFLTFSYHVILRHGSLATSNSFIFLVLWKEMIAAPEILSFNIHHNGELAPWTENFSLQAYFFLCMKTTYSNIAVVLCSLL